MKRLKMLITHPSCCDLNTTRVLKAMSCVLLVSALTACAVGPDFAERQHLSSQAYAPVALSEALPTSDASLMATTLAGATQHIDARQEVLADWWTLFQSPALNRLIERAFAANPTLAASQAALRQAQENVAVQQGYFFPTLSADYSFTRQQLAGNNGGNSPGIQNDGSNVATTQNPQGPVYNAPVIYNFHTAGLTVGYVPDLFGGNRRQLESLRASVDMQRFELEATYITLASNVVAGALQEASLRAQMAALEKMLASYKQSLALVRERQRLGYAMRLDVAQQESALATAQQQMPLLRKQFEQTRDLLRALVGNFQDQEIDETFVLEALHLPEHLPLSIPSELIQQRPDVRAAEAQWHAATAQVGVAQANRFPQFSINGTFGGQATTFNQMFRAGAPFWSLGGSITQPLFDGGSLLHRKRFAEQVMLQAQAQYRSAVLTACQNVADTLHALAEDAEALRAAAASKQAAQVSRDVTRTQLQLGYVSSLEVLSVEAAYQQAEMTLVQAQVTRLGDTAALFQALGGGWWQRNGSRD